MLSCPGGVTRRPSSAGTACHRSRVRSLDEVERQACVLNAGMFPTFFTCLGGPCDRADGVRHQLSSFRRTGEYGTGRARAVWPLRRRYSRGASVLVCLWREVQAWFFRFHGFAPATSLWARKRARPAARSRDNSCAWATDIQEASESGPGVGVR
jgi:hypothetical protein